MSVAADRFVCAVVPVEAIVRLAEKYPVFPCRRDAEEIVVGGVTKLYKSKSPLTQDGLYDATQDVDQIRAWWNRWPTAIVGVPTGALTRLVVVDYDTGKTDAAGQTWVQENVEALMSTRCHGTLSGGKHYLFRLPKGHIYRNGVCLTLAGERRAGIDLRADGGYIIWWPLHGAMVSGIIAPLPAGLVDEYHVGARELEPLPAASPSKWGRDRQVVADALAFLSPESRDVWLKAGMAIHLACGGSDDGFALWHTWSAGGLDGTAPGTYMGVNDCRYAWASFKHAKDRDGLVTLGTLFELAKGAGYVSRGTSAPEIGPSPLESYAEDEAAVERAAIQAEAAPLVEEEDAPANLAMDWKDLDGKVPPIRSWAIKHWLGMGHVTLLSGAGGTGKTSIAQAAGACIAIGRDYLGEIGLARKVLMWAAEDDKDELWRRQLAIAQWLNVPLSAFADRFYVHCYDGEQIELASTIDQRRLFSTTHYTTLREQIGDYQAEVVILDNVARLFAGNENDRHQVTSFVSMLTAAARPMRASVLLLGHPAKGIGSEYSGSTAWEGAARGRLYLGYKLPGQTQDNDTETSTIGDGSRFLSKRKANYSDEDWRRITYQDGVMVPDQIAAPGEGRGNPTVFGRAIVARALRKLNQMEEFGSASTASPSYLPKIAKRYKLLEDLTEREFIAAMVAMRKDGELVLKTVGTYANRSPKQALWLASELV